ncbi:hypothetical protein SAY87_026649 [Trapa incisa]|uniref:RRM domain-containing protein n=1 Tax=Trapa incisa TaxID=236973 RepID=A0AAN7JM33_9MYRT|nr:hypothetical protein SAY87_026649 [Trapa incisa]
MAFLKIVGNLLCKASTGHSSLDISAHIPSLYQAFRSMSSKLFVGGLSYATDDICLRETFSIYGEINEAKVIIDRQTGRSRGFGFISFRSSSEAYNAMEGMDGKDLHGRRIKVNYAQEKSHRGFGNVGFRDEMAEYGNPVRNSSGYRTNTCTGVSCSFYGGGSVISGSSGDDIFSSNDHAGDGMPGAVSDPQRGQLGGNSSSSAEFSDGIIGHSTS